MCVCVCVWRGEGMCVCVSVTVVYSSLTSYAREFGNETGARIVFNGNFSYCY